jgi:hypothetical protein
MDVDVEHVTRRTGAIERSPRQKTRHMPAAGLDWKGISIVSPPGARLVLCL